MEQKFKIPDSFTWKKWTLACIASVVFLLSGCQSAKNAGTRLFDRGIPPATNIKEQSNPQAQKTIETIYPVTGKHGSNPNRPLEIKPLGDI